MKTNKENNPNPESMQELSLDELEDVNGGGIKEIVAATTLAAMAMTGNTVSAFGLANALAEDAGHVEYAPEQEAYGQDYFGGEMVEEIAIEAVDAEVPVAEAEAVDLDDLEDSEVVFNDDGEPEEMPAAEGAAEAAEGAAEGEVEFDLSDANEDEAAEDDFTDPEQTLTDLIDMTLDETKDQGLYAALNSTFATLADNAEAIADPETGVIGMSGGEIVNATYDALSARFDATPEQLMGAIGAAASRADAAGYIQALGGDAALVSLAAAESDSSNADAMRYAKSYFDSMMNAIALACPEFKPFVPMLSALGGDIFSTGTNPNAEVLRKLNDIENQIQSAEDSIKRDKFVFVNKGSSNIELDRAVVARHVRFKEYFANNQKSAFKSETSNMPLSAKQMEALCDYAASKKRNLFDFLFNDMRFAPVESSTEKMGNDDRNIGHVEMSNGLYIPGHSGKHPFPKPKPNPDVIQLSSYDFADDYDFNEDTQTWSRPSQNVWMLDGAQKFVWVRGSDFYSKYFEAELLSATNVGRKKNENTRIFYYDDYGENWIGRQNLDVLMFQPR